MAKEKLSFEYEVSSDSADPKSLMGTVGSLGCSVVSKAAEGALVLKVKNENGVPTVTESSIEPKGGDFERIASAPLAQLEKDALALVKGHGNGEEIEIKIESSK